MMISGFSYLIQGWVLGVEGFSATNRLPTLAGILSVIAWYLWLGIHAMQVKAPSGSIGISSQIGI